MELLAELEQAEKERDRAIKEARAAVPLINRQRERAEAAEARLAAVPALVEALMTIAWCGEEEPVDDIALQHIAREALAAFESSRDATR